MVVVALLAALGTRGAGHAFPRHAQHRRTPEGRQEVLLMVAVYCRTCRPPTRRPGSPSRRLRRAGRSRSGENIQEDWASRFSPVTGRCSRRHEPGYKTMRAALAAPGADFLAPTLSELTGPVFSSDDVDPARQRPDRQFGSDGRPHRRAAWSCTGGHGRRGSAVPHSWSRSGNANAGRYATYKAATAPDRPNFSGFGR
jgi:hypothetical protein